MLSAVDKMVKASEAVAFVKLVVEKTDRGLLDCDRNNCHGSFRRVMPPGSGKSLYGSSDVQKDVVDGSCQPMNKDHSIGCCRGQLLE